MLVGLVALFATMTVLCASWASASLVAGESFSEEFPMASSKDVPPGPDGTFVHDVAFTLQAGQSRRVSDQLTVTLSGDGAGGAEVDNNIECFDQGTTHLATDAVGGGTNNAGSQAGHLSLRASFLFTAPHDGTFDCKIQAVTSHDMTAVADTWPKGTWLELDNFTADPPQQWEAPFCDSQGRQTDSCIYLGRPVWGSNPSTAVLYDDGTTWTAAPDAVTADLEGHMQITSCFFGTGSCIPTQWGDSWLQEWPADDTAVFHTHLDVIQLDPSGQPCQVTSTGDQQYTITNDVHHYLVEYGPKQIHVSASCGGSRTFKLQGVVTWVSGNPVKIDSGSATNANIIVETTAPTSTVPSVIRTDQASAAARIRAAGLAVGTITPVIAFTQPGLVLAQNSPAETVEPVRSPVDLTVSLGAVTVPDLNSLTLAEAAHTLNGLGLTPDISNQDTCIDPAHVINQSPSAGVVLAPGSTVRITVDSGTPRTCGSTK